MKPVLEFFTLFGCFLTLFAGSEYDIKKQQSNIFGGKMASRGQFPFQVLLRVIVYKGGKQMAWRCGGSLLDDNHVLSAAHCFSPRYDEVIVGAGHVDRWKLVKRSARHVYSHKNYKDNYVEEGDDVAMILLDEAYNLKHGSIETIELISHVPADGESCVVTGWGRTEHTNNPTILRYALVSIRNIDECDRNYTTDTDPPLNKKKLLCANNPKNDTCQGDSGGPLICQGKLAGVTSFGPIDCGSANHPGVYTNAALYKDWIVLAKEQLKIMSTGSTYNVRLKQIVYRSVIIPFLAAILL